MPARNVPLRYPRLVRAAPRSADRGEVVFEVERFGLSANNITYALLGDELRYWDLFPADPGWGRIPVWGYLRAADSAVPGIETGSRAFGLCPMATHVVLRPGRVGTATFTEESPHRAGLSSVYNVYARTAASLHDRGTPSDDALVVLRPVFWLSFTLDYYLNGRVPPGHPVIVTSASSKAAIGLAHLLAARGVPVTGLTSERHVAFVRSLALYQRVLPYDELREAPAAGAVLVDRLSSSYSPAESGENGLPVTLAGTRIRYGGRIRASGGCRVRQPGRLAAGGGRAFRLTGI